MREKFINVLDRSLAAYTQKRIDEMLALPRIIEYASPIFNTLAEIAAARPQPKNREQHFHFWYHFGDPKNHYWGMSYHSIYLDFGWIKGDYGLKFPAKPSYQGQPENFERIGGYRIGYHIDPHDLHIAESDHYRSTEYYVRTNEPHFMARGFRQIHDPVDFVCGDIKAKVAGKTYFSCPVNVSM